MIPFLDALKTHMEVDVVGFDEFLEQFGVGHMAVVPTALDVAPLDLASDREPFSDLRDFLLNVAYGGHVYCDAANSHELVAHVARFIAKVEKL